MRVVIAKHDCSILWEGVYYFALSDYPRVSDWEIARLLRFLAYERAHGRETVVEYADGAVREAFERGLQTPERYRFVAPPPKITACTACRQGGCLSEYLCHTASVADAQSILASGRLLCAARARGKAPAALAREARNAARDPEDFFDYVMFAWGNCQAGDRLVLERALGREPSSAELEGPVTPGVRFYYRYEALARAANACDDGYHPLKLRGEWPVGEALVAIVAPRGCAAELLPCAPEALRGKLYFLDEEGLDIAAWSARVYEFVCRL